MRRELIFSIAGFLAGFVVAAVVFFQPAPDPSQPDKRPAQPIVAATAPEPSSAQDPGRIGRPIVIKEEEPAATEPAGEANKKTPATLMHEVLASLPGLSERDRDRAVDGLVAELRKQGPAGLQAIRDFLKGGKDVKLRNGWGMSNGRITSAPSLRIALLDALNDWPGATELNLEMMRSTSRAFEASLAIRNLEAASPGTYRAEAIRTMTALASQPMKGEFATEGMNYIFDAMRHFNAPELLPAAEKLVASQPWAAFQLMDALKDMAPEVRGPAYARLFADPKIAQQLASNPHTLRNLGYSDPQVAQQAAQWYANAMDAKQRDKFLADFGSNRSFSFRNDFFATQQSRTAHFVDTGSGPQNAELVSRLAFLDQIAPHSTTPVLQQRLAEAREELNNAIANPSKVISGQPVEISGTRFIELGAGAGNMKIKGDTIQTIEIKQK